MVFFRPLSRLLIFPRRADGWGDGQPYGRFTDCRAEARKGGGTPKVRWRVGRAGPACRIGVGSR